MVGILISKFISHNREQWVEYMEANVKDFEIIKKTQKLIDILYKESLNGAWIYHKEEFGIKFDQYLMDEY